MQISTGAHRQISSAATAYVLSGINPKEVYDAAEKLLAQAAHDYPGFAPAALGSIPTTRRTSTSTSIAIAGQRLRRLRRAKIESLLRNAYSQNYVYLIKKPTTNTR